MIALGRKSCKRCVCQEGEEEARVRLRGGCCISFSSSLCVASMFDAAESSICFFLLSLGTLTFFFGGSPFSSLLPFAFLFFGFLREPEDEDEEEDDEEDEGAFVFFFPVSFSASFCFFLRVVIHVLICFTVKTSASSNLFDIRSTILLALILGLSSNISSRNAICSAVLYLAFSFGGLIADPRPSFIDRESEGCQEMIEEEGGAKREAGDEADDTEEQAEGAFREAGREDDDDADKNDSEDDDEDEAGISTSWVTCFCFTI
jgi:hypothetical protein